MKKKWLLLFFVLFSFSIFGQNEKRDHKLSFYFSLLGAGYDFSLTNSLPDLPHGYKLLINPQTGYSNITFHASFFWKEKWGLRTEYSTRNHSGSQNAFKSYLENSFPDYYVFAGLLYYGYHYKSISEAVTYRFNKDHFFFEPFAGPGYGKFSPPAYEEIYKRKGSNDFKEIHYLTEKKMLWSANLGTDISYHFNMKNVNTKFVLGISLAFIYVPVKYSVTYTEQDYAQPQLSETFEVKDKMINMGGSIFIGFALR